MLKVTNPANGKIVGELPEDDAARIQKKADAARAAQPEWAARPLKERIACVLRFRELLVSRTEKLAEILTSEVGKPLKQAKNEITGTLGRLDFFVEHVERAIHPDQVWRDPKDHLTERISWEPLGVVANISAWNYPYFVGSNVMFPALLTGNAVLYKPSEFSSLTGMEIARLFHEAGVPEAIFAPVIGGGKVGAALLEQKLNGVFFTGSYRTGRAIAEAVAGRMIRVGMELGGKDPIYVCDDVDVKATVDGVADGAFYNAGQSCCSVERIYVHAKIYDQFVEGFVSAVRDFKVGDPMGADTYIGPLTRAAQIETLEAQVADAKAKGARLLLGGKRMTGNYFEPTVLGHANHSMLLMRDESFGPIIGIARVENDEEALRLMNDTDYGLTAGVYTKDRARAEKILAKVDAGSAYWNCCDRVVPRLPWSGRHHSGMGSTLSAIGIQAFVQPKAWHLRG